MNVMVSADGNYSVRLMQKIILPVDFQPRTYARALRLGIKYNRRPIPARLLLRQLRRRADSSGQRRRRRRERRPLWRPSSHKSASRTD